MNSVNAFGKRIMVWFSSVVLLIPIATAAATNPDQNPALFLSPGFLSKPATLAVPSMTTTMKSYTHAGRSGEVLSDASNCIVEHAELSVSSVALDSITVVPVASNNKDMSSSSSISSLKIIVNGITPLQTTTEKFAVKCGYDGALAAAVHLPQEGTYSYTVHFDQGIEYNVPLAVDVKSGKVTFSSPQLTTPVRAESSYMYNAEGFALDLFVSNYFANTVVGRIESEVLKLLSYPSAFPTAWFESAAAAVSSAEFVCGAPSTVPNDANAMALYMQPGCSADASINVDYPLLASNDIMVLLPSDDGSAAAMMESPTQPTFVHQMHRHMKSLEAQKKEDHKILESTTSSTLPAWCTPVNDCNFVLNTTLLTIQLSDCTVCYPNNGMYTELAAKVTPSYKP